MADGSQTESNARGHKFTQETEGYSSSSVTDDTAAPAADDDINKV